MCWQWAGNTCDQKPGYAREKGGGPFQLQNLARIKLKSVGGPDSSWAFVETNNTNASLGLASPPRTFGAYFRGTDHKEAVEYGQVQVVAGPALQDILLTKEHILKKNGGCGWPACNLRVQADPNSELAKALKTVVAPGGTQQKSLDGVGKNAEMTFIKVIQWTKSRSSIINPYSGVSMKVVHDDRTSRDYLYFIESPSHVMRMVDVTSNEANAGKVTSVISVVGPQLLATGVQSNDFFVMDGKGVLFKVDLQPVIHCGNQVDFFKKGFASWKPIGTVDQHAILGPLSHVYNLIRKGASENAKAHPWELIVQKKIVNVKGVKGAMVSKSISCSRPVMSSSSSSVNRAGNHQAELGDSVSSRGATATKFCCVEKVSSGRDMSNLTKEDQERVTDTIMKI